MAIYFFGIENGSTRVIDQEGENLSCADIARTLCDQMAESLARNRRPQGEACVFVLNSSGSEIHRSYLRKAGRKMLAPSPAVTFNPFYENASEEPASA